MENWKAPGPDGVQEIWFKRFRSLHGVVGQCLQRCLNVGEVGSRLDGEGKDGYHTEGSGQWNGSTAGLWLTW